MNLEELRIGIELGGWNRRGCAEVLDYTEALIAALRDFQRADIAAFGHVVGTEWMTQGEHLWELTRSFRESVDALLPPSPGP